MRIRSVLLFRDDLIVAKSQGGVWDCDEACISPALRWIAWPPPPKRPMKGLEGTISSRCWTYLAASQDFKVADYSLNAPDYSQVLKFKRFINLTTSLIDQKLECLSWLPAVCLLTLCCISSLSMTTPSVGFRKTTYVCDILRVYLLIHTVCPFSTLYWSWSQLYDYFRVTPAMHVCQSNRATAGMRCRQKVHLLSRSGVGYPAEMYKYAYPRLTPGHAATSQRISLIQSKFQKKELHSQHRAKCHARDANLCYFGRSILSCMTI